MYTSRPNLERILKHLKISISDEPLKFIIHKNMITVAPCCFLQVGQSGGWPPTGI